MANPPKPPVEALPRVSGPASGRSDAGPPSSEGGINYVDLPHVNDDERLPRDPMAALEKLTQLNGPSAARGANACGATSIVAALVSSRGYPALLKLADAIHDELSDETYAELITFAEPIALGYEGATFGALGAFVGVLHRRYRGFDGGMPYEKLRHLMSVAGFSAPRFIDDDSIASTMTGAGQRWPAKIVMDGGDEGDHWVLVGRDARGLFVYDPYPRADRSQVIRVGEPDWKKYAAAIGRDEVGKDTIGFLPKA